MADTRNIPKTAGQQGADTGEMNQGAKNNPGMCSKTQPGAKNTPQDCGQRRKVSDIQPHMEVISSCGCTMGKVDHLEGEAIKLTRNDSPDGQHHFIPVNWVESVDNHVHLKKNAEETLQGWKPDAASCGMNA